MSETSAPALRLSVLLCKEDGNWLAHCLELDLVEAGATLEAARDALIDVIRAHVLYAFENDNLAHLFHSAPAEAWRSFFAAKRLDSIDIDLSVDDDDDHMPSFPPHIAVLAASGNRVSC